MTCYNTNIFKYNLNPLISVSCLCRINESCQELTPPPTTIKAHRIYSASVSTKWCIIYLLCNWNPFRQNETKTFSCMMTTLYQYPSLFQTCIDALCFYVLFMLSVSDGWKRMTSFFYLRKYQISDVLTFINVLYLFTIL